MTKIKLSKIELKKLEKKEKETKDQKTFRRLQCIHLKHQGKMNKEIVKIIGVCPNTITSWLKLFSEKGIGGLCDMNFDRRKSKIDPHIDNIKKDLQENIISTLAELQDWINDKYEVKLEQSWLSRCCKKNSISLTRNHV